MTLLPSSEKQWSGQNFWPNPMQSIDKSNPCPTLIGLCGHWRWFVLVLFTLFDSGFVCAFSLITLVCLHVTGAMLFLGYAVGSHHRRIGGGSNQLCLPEKPQLQTHNKRRMYTGYLYGIEYRTNGDPGGTTAYHAKPTPCAVCYVPQRSAQLMIPASNTCPVGWTREYNGYLMAQYSYPRGGQYFNFHSTNYICIDELPEFSVGPIRQYQALLYFVRIGCGTLPCSKFTEGLNVPCVVCTKW